MRRHCDRRRSLKTFGPEGVHCRVRRLLSPPLILAPDALLYNHWAMTTLISIECWEPMGRDRSVRQPWSDVRISFVTGPGGETIEFEPTLVSYARLERDLDFEREYQRKHPEEDRSETIERLATIVEHFNNGAEFYIDSDSADDRVPEIYTSHEFIDQPEAERMLVHFLGTQGIKDVGFQWIWPDIVCPPI